MDSLNMSKLNLSSVRSQPAGEVASKAEVSGKKVEPNILLDDEDYHCEYKEDIWKNLLEQDALKPPIHLQSPQLEFRGALIQRLRDATRRLGLSLATLHAAAAQLDLFMDAHTLRADRLTHVAMACLSLAAKSEEKFSRAPTLKILSKISGVQLCGKTFRQLEWMVGQHARWRLLAPTPATFAALLAEHVVTDTDLTTRHPKFVRRFKRDGAKLLDAYLDLTLSDVRLKVIENADVGCACVACARAELGLAAWPGWLAARAQRSADAVTPVARFLMRMMEILKKSRESVETSEIDQGYGSARTSPNITPSTSPHYQVSPASSTSSKVDTSYRHKPITLERSDSYTVLDMEDQNTLPQTQIQFTLPQAMDVSCQRVSALDLKFCRSRRLLEASLGNIEQKGVKRGLDSNVDLDSKRYRLTAQMSQVVL